MLMKKWRENPQEIYDFLDAFRRQKQAYSIIPDEDDDDELHSTPKLTSSASAAHHHDHNSRSDATPSRSSIYDVFGAPAQTNTTTTAASSKLAASTTTKLSVLETFHLALPFGFLWFMANYSSVACLEYTTVGSATILTSTSSIWTLILGALVGVERFTLPKLMGVLASLAGIVLISSLDVSADDDKDRGSFPHKTAREIAVGDALALASSLIYGIYIVVLKRRIGHESRVNMPIFFGLVGLLNLVLMWPGFLLLHLLGIESFALPSSAKVILIIVVNSTSSLVSDFCWAFAMLLTSPLVVTVGLSLTIPLSLVGQMVISGTYSGWWYWVGAGVVVASFVFVNHEESKHELPVDEDVHASSGGV
jgi:solute carrier family 35 protein F5